MPQQTTLRTVANVRFFVVIYALSVAFLAGCEKRLVESNFDVVNRQFAAAQKQGRSLSIKEVESVLGQPGKIEKGQIEQPATRLMPLTRYIYTQDGQTVELHFVNGQLAKEVRFFGKAEPEDTNRLHMNKPPAAEPKPAATEGKKP